MISLRQPATIKKLTVHNRLSRIHSISLLSVSADAGQLYMKVDSRSWFSGISSISWLSNIWKWSEYLLGVRGWAPEANKVVHNPFPNYPISEAGQMHKWTPDADLAINTTCPNLKVVGMMRKCAPEADLHFPTFWSLSESCRSGLQKPI